jgi:hypothetical protein
MPSRIWAEENKVYTSWDKSLIEWVENKEQGLEQGFILTERPMGLRDVQPLILTLTVLGDLSAKSDPGEQQVAFRDQKGHHRLTYGGLLVIDAGGSRVPASIKGTGSSIKIIIYDHQAIYPLNIDPLIQQAYLKSSNAGAGDCLGYSVAISGDTVVVGAPGEGSNSTGVNGNGGDNSASYAGAAYVFVRSGGVWAQQAYFKPSNTGAWDQFGYSVAISGDTVVIGAPYEDSSTTGVNGNGGDNSAADSGAAYVFVRSGGVWAQQAYLKASNSGAGGQFGYSVAISGDTVVIGGPYEDSSTTGVNGNGGDNSAADSGAAYVFVRSGGVWAQQAYFKASNTGTGDRFGWSVAVSGGSVVVGAPYEDSNATGVNGNGGNNSAPDSGAVYVFVRIGASWTQQAYLKTSNHGQDELLGYSVAISGDVVIVGSLGDGWPGANAGAAYVFGRSDGAWLQQAYLKASNAGAGDYFGYSVAISGDTVVVGALYEDSNATGVNGNGGDNSAVDAGAAYVFVRSGGSWFQQAYLKASNTGAGDWFGISVAISGDTVVVGSSLEDSNSTWVNGSEGNNSAEEAGAAYVFTFLQAGPFNKMTPTIEATGQSTNPTLTWANSSWAISYEYCYDTTNNNSCNGSWVSTGINTNAALSGLSLGTTYYWQVRALNAAGTIEADSGTWWKFSTQVAPPGDFIKASPAEGAANQSTSPTLTWGSSSGAVSYEACYDISNDNDCSSWTSSGTTTSISLNGLANNTTYYWQARAINAGGITYADGGAWWSFTTMVGYHLPFATTYSASGITTSGAILNGIVNPNNGSTTVTFQYGPTPAYESTVAADQSPITGSINIPVSKEITGLSANTTYYYRVVAVNNAGTANGEEQAFRTLVGPSLGTIIYFPLILKFDQ